MAERDLLRFGQILQQRAGRRPSGRKILEAQLFARAHAEMLPQQRFIDVFPEVFRAERAHTDPAPFGQLRQIRAAHIKRFVADQLGRFELADLIHQCGGAPQLRYEKRAGRNVAESYAEGAVFKDHGKNVVVAAFIQRFRADIRPGRDHADDLALHESLRELRILHLLRDRDLVALLHEAVHISVYRMEGDAAHRRALGEAAVLAGQYELQLFRRRFRIIKKHLVEVPETVKQNAIFIFFLGRQVMLHHGGKHRPSSCF